MMPFLSEELFHKLPDYQGKSETIVNGINNYDKN